jgi:hypothetical protein
MNGADLLHEAGALVGFGWCQGATARTTAGVPVDVCAHDAATWSLLGALQAAAFRDDPMDVDDIRVAMEAIGELIVDPSLSHWNDAPGRTQLEVCNLLARAERLTPTAA